MLKWMCLQKRRYSEPSTVWKLAKLSAERASLVFLKTFFFLWGSIHALICESMGHRTVKILDRQDNTKCLSAVLVKKAKPLILLKDLCRTYCLGTGNKHSANSLQLPLGDQYWESLLCNEMQNIFLFPHVQYLILFPRDASNDTMDKHSLPAECHPWEDIKDEQTRARGWLIGQELLHPVLCWRKRAR